MSHRTNTDTWKRRINEYCNDGFDRTLRNIFYNGIGKIDKDIKEELKRQEQVILSTVDKDKREELKEEAQEEANKILNKKGIIN